VLLCLSHRWPDLQAGVLTAPDCVMVLSERLQMFRDTEVSCTHLAACQRVAAPVDVTRADMLAGHVRAACFLFGSLGRGDPRYTHYAIPTP
jgi:hypothetical protein